MTLGVGTLRAALDRVLDHVAHLFPQGDLEPGTAYVVLGPGRPPRLTVCELAEVGVPVEAAHLLGEVVPQAYAHAVVEDAIGQRHTVPRTTLLWHVAHHEAIHTAARAMGVPLVPSSWRAGPVWRLGGVRLHVADMVELGTLLRQR